MLQLIWQLTKGQTDKVLDFKNSNPKLRFRRYNPKTDLISTNPNTERDVYLLAQQHNNENSTDAIFKLQNQLSALSLQENKQFLKNHRITQDKAFEQFFEIRLQTAINRLEKLLESSSIPVKLVPQNQPFDVTNRYKSVMLDISCRPGAFIFQGDGNISSQHFINFCPKFRPGFKLPKWITQSWERFDTWSSTTCHVTDMKTNQRLSVVLKVSEEDPYELLDPSKDDRLAPEKYKAIQQIVNAKTLYEVLGIQESAANDSSIKKAWRKTSLLVHPDKNGFEYAKEASQSVNAAFEKLKTKEGRDEYRRNTAKYPVMKIEVVSKKVKAPKKLPMVIRLIEDKERHCYASSINDGVGLRFAILTANFGDNDKYRNVISALEEAWGRQDEDGVIDHPSYETKISTRSLKQVFYEMWTNDEFVLTLKHVKERLGNNRSAQVHKYIEIDIWTADTYDIVEEFAKGRMAKEVLLGKMKRRVVKCKNFVDKLFGQS
eukprot:TRINITY_DN4125_c0_g2_i3.p1 TRINITY_DN4125_c0_g2~~TRINITY_DN4125_c0_g2_i3.p1  ORF type:complete len:489 (-),score=44.13 TRINITY_DN4125_c0_g2_i3:433-1899(-)